VILVIFLIGSKLWTRSRRRPPLLLFFYYLIMDKDQDYLDHRHHHHHEFFLDSLPANPPPQHILHHPDIPVRKDKVACSHPNCKRKTKGGDQPVHGSKFCTKHKCRRDDCHKQAVRSTRLCTIHGQDISSSLTKCAHPNCKRRKDSGDYALPNAKYCQKHKCKVDDCFKLALRATKLCTFHGKIEGVKFPPKRLNRSPMNNHSLHHDPVLPIDDYLNAPL